MSQFFWKKYSFAANCSDKLTFFNFRRKTACDMTFFRGSKSLCERNVIELNVFAHWWQMLLYSVAFGNPVIISYQTLNLTQIRFIQHKLTQMQNISRHLYINTTREHIVTETGRPPQRQTRCVGRKQREIFAECNNGVTMTGPTWLTPHETSFRICTYF